MKIFVVENVLRVGDLIINLEHIEDLEFAYKGVHISLNEDSLYISIWRSGYQFAENNKKSCFVEVKGTTYGDIEVFPRVERRGVEDRRIEVDDENM